ncbi:MAG: hypothetical protein HC932_00140 [Thermales bacterium]|nr:hypothetical protein [Thermales bacterium]
MTRVREYFNILIPRYKKPPARSDKILIIMYNEKLNPRQVDECVGSFVLELFGLGYLDLRRTVEVAKDASIDEADFRDYVEYYINSNYVQNIDICGLLYDYILEFCKCEISRYFAKMALPQPNFDNIYTHQDYYCSGYDRVTEICEALETIPESEMSATMLWFYNQLL